MRDTKLEIGNIGARIDLLIKQGATFGRHEVTIHNPDETPVDISGCTFAGAIKRTPKDSSAITFVFAILDAPKGTFEFGIADETTATIRAGNLLSDFSSKYVYDIEMHDTQGNVIPLFYGDVKVFRRVTP